MIPNKPLATRHRRQRQRAVGESTQGRGASPNASNSSQLFLIIPTVKGEFVFDGSGRQRQSGRPNAVALVRQGVTISTPIVETAIHVDSAVSVGFVVFRHVNLKGDILCLCSEGQKGQQERSEVAHNKKVLHNKCTTE